MTCLDSKWNVFNLVKKNGGSILTNFCVVHQWVVHKSIITHIKDSGIWFCLPWKSPSRLQILNTKITKTHNDHKQNKMGHNVSWLVGCDLYPWRKKNYRNRKNSIYAFNVVNCRFLQDQRLLVFLYKFISIHHLFITFI